jgi:hypothetical protein
MNISTVLSIKIRQIFLEIILSLFKVMKWCMELWIIRLFLLFNRWKIAVVHPTLYNINVSNIVYFKPVENGPTIATASGKPSRLLTNKSGST